jgi:hypothetical protein
VIDVIPEIDVPAVIEPLVGLIEQQQLGAAQLSEHDVQLLAGASAELSDRLIRPAGASPTP